MSALHLDSLPHTGVARLVRAIRTTEPGSIVCEGWIPATSPFVERSRCSVWLGIEMGAQAAALLELADRQDLEREEIPSIGYLVRVRAARARASFLPAAAPIRVAARRLPGLPPLYTYEIVVGEEGTELLSGQISTYIASEAGAASQTSRKQNH